MKTFIRVSIFFVFALLFAQCEKSGDPELPAGQDFSCAENPVTCDLTKANGHFAIDLFRKLHEEAPEDNLFISPFSISTALSMTANGANEQTLEDMRDALRVSNIGQSAVNDAYRQLLEVLPALDPQTKLKLANSIWPQAPG